MAEEQNGSRRTRGPFHLGESFGELGPGLGRLHAAWREGSDRPALVLIPGEDVEWRPDGPWRVSLACDPDQGTVTLDVEQAPPGADVSELANTLVLLTAAVERVEDKPQVRTHIARGSASSSAPWVPPAKRSWSMRALAAMAVFALGSGLGLFIEHSPSVPGDLTPELTSPTATSMNSPSLFANSRADAGTIAYPLPAKPFPDQATTPCRCWLYPGGS